MASLVGEDSVSDVVDLGVDVLDFASMQLVGMDFLEGFGFGGMDVLARFFEMAFWSLACLGVVLLDVVFGEQGPADEVASLDGL